MTSDDPEQNFEKRWRVTAFSVSRSQGCYAPHLRDEVLDDIRPMPAWSLGLSIRVIARHIRQCFPALDQIRVGGLAVGRRWRALLDMRVANELAFARIHHAGVRFNDLFRTQRS